MGERVRSKQVAWLIGRVVFVLTVYAGMAAGQLSKSPGEIVKASWTACNDGRYSEVETYLSTEMLAVVKGGTPEARRGGLKALCDRDTRQGTVQQVEIVNEEIRGEGARVQAKITFKDGKVKSRDITELIQEGGHWKITGGGS